MSNKDVMGGAEAEERLARQFLQGRIDRRTFLHRGAVMGATGGGLLASLLAACGGSTKPLTNTTTSDAGTGGGAAVKGGTLKAALTGEPDSLDPAKSQIYTGAQV